MEISNGSISSPNTLVNSRFNNTNCLTGVCNKKRANSITSLSLEATENKLPLPPCKKMRTEEDDGNNILYTENIKKFNTTYKFVQKNAPAYTYENVLNHSKNTFGLEIEFLGGNTDKIATELKKLGLCPYSKRVPYHSHRFPRIPGKWNLEFDHSVAELGKPIGGELVSPILTDTPKTWQEIKLICDIIKKHGGAINEKCGGHVHVGILPLGLNGAKWTMFFKIISRFEDEIYRLAGGDLGKIRNKYPKYARPFFYKAGYAATGRFKLKTISDLRQLAHKQVFGLVQPDHKEVGRNHGINLKNLCTEDTPQTIEFRLFNGSLNPIQIQANVLLAVSVIEAAGKLGSEENFQNELFKKQKEILINHRIDQRKIMNTSSMKKLLDILFSRKIDKDKILWVFAKNNWAGHTSKIPIPSQAKLPSPN